MRLSRCLAKRLAGRPADPGPRRRAVSGPVLAAGLSLLAATGPAAADACPGLTQSALNACAAAEAGRADAALNAAYAALTRRVDPDVAEALRAAQRAWLAYRDASCALEAPDGPGAGSARPMVRSGCLARFTRDRVRILEGYLACEEGDLACVTRPRK